MTSETVIGSLLIAIGAALVAAAGWLLVLARKSTTWPSARGHVLSAVRDSVSASSRSGGTTYKLAVTYAYEVSGNRFDGRRVAFVMVGTAVMRGWIKVQ